MLSGNISNTYAYTSCYQWVSNTILSLSCHYEIDVTDKRKNCKQYYLILRMTELQLGCQRFQILVQQMYRSMFVNNVGINQNFQINLLRKKLAFSLLLSNQNPSFMLIDTSLVSYL